MEKDKEFILEEVLEELRFQRYLKEDEIFERFQKSLANSLDSDFFTPVDYGVFYLPNFLFRSERFKEKFVEEMSKNFDFLNAQISKIQKEIERMNSGEDPLDGLLAVMSALGISPKPGMGKRTADDIRLSIERKREEEEMFLDKKEYLEGLVKKFAPNDIHLLLKLQDKM